MGAGDGSDLGGGLGGVLGGGRHCFVSFSLLQCRARCRARCRACCARRRAHLEAPEWSAMGDAAGIVGGDGGLGELGDAEVGRGHVVLVDIIFC